MESFEYAIKKDVRNNPIVREVDEARQRELWKSVGVAGFLVDAERHERVVRHCPHHVGFSPGHSANGMSPSCMISRTIWVKPARTVSSSIMADIGDLRNRPMMSLTAASSPRFLAIRAR